MVVGDRFVTLDGLTYGLGVTDVEAKDVKLQEYAGYRMRWLEVKVDPDIQFPAAYKPFKALLMFNRCVTIALYTTKLRLRVFTPWQLYRKLREFEHSPKKALKHGIISVREV